MYIGCGGVVKLDTESHAQKRSSGKSSLCCVRVIAVRNEIVQAQERNTYVLNNPPSYR